MRIITGSVRGRRLQSLEGMETSPTTDRVKEAIFSIIQFDIEGRSVLDLFAGSGQIGLEALSRGAISAVFVDSNKPAAEVIRKNIKTCGFEDISKVYSVDYKVFLASKSEKFDIAFIDPPYSGGFLQDALIKATYVMNDSALIICEHSKDEELPFEIDDFKMKKQYKYGKTIITVFRKGEEL